MLVLLISNKCRVSLFLVNAFIFNFDLAFFEKVSNGAFKRILAQAEFAFDDLGGGFVVEGEDAGEFFDYAEDALCIFVDLDVGFLAVGDVHLAIFFYLGNAEVKDFAWAVFAVGFPGRNKGRIFVINGYKYAEAVTDLIDAAFYGIACYVWSSGGKVVVYLHGSTEAAALIHVKGYQTFLTFPHTAGLLMVWKEQVFLKSPVKECADLGYLKDLQDCGLAYLEKRFSGSGDQAVFGIFVNKYVQSVAFSGSFRNLFRWKKYSVFLACIFIFCKVNTEIYGLCQIGRASCRERV